MTFSTVEERHVLRGLQIDVQWSSVGTVSAIVRLKESSGIGAGEISALPDVAETAETYVFVQQAWTGVFSGVLLTEISDRDPESLLVAEFRSSRSQYMPLIRGERVLDGTALTERTAEPVRASVRDAQAKARDPTVSYDELEELNELVSRTIVKIQSVASLNLPSLHAVSP